MCHLSITSTSEGCSAYSALLFIVCLSKTSAHVYILLCWNCGAFEDLETHLSTLTILSVGFFFENNIRGTNFIG